MFLLRFISCIYEIYNFISYFLAVSEPL